MSMSSQEVRAKLEIISEKYVENQSKIEGKYSKISPPKGTNTRKIAQNQSKIEGKKSKKKIFLIEKNVVLVSLCVVLVFYRPFP